MLRTGPTQPGGREPLRRHCLGDPETSWSDTLNTELIPSYLAQLAVPPMLDRASPLRGQAPGALLRTPGDAGFWLSIETPGLVQRQRTVDRPAGLVVSSPEEHPLTTAAASPPYSAPLDRSRARKLGKIRSTDEKVGHQGIISADRQVNLDQFIYGPEGPAGRVTDVVIHPVHRTLTHVVIGPRQRYARARLMGIDALDMYDDGTLRTALSDWEIGELPMVEERDYLRITEPPELTGPWTVGFTRMLAAPYYSSGTIGRNAYSFSPETACDIAGLDPSLVVLERPLSHEVEIRRLSGVVDKDGAPVGHVEAFVTDSADRVTHVVVDGGHLSSYRECTIPIAVTLRVDNDRVELTCTREELAALPSVPFHRHHLA